MAALSCQYYKDEGIIIIPTLQRVNGNGFLVLVSSVYSYGPPGNKFMVLFALSLLSAHPKLTVKFCVTQLTMDIFMLVNNIL